MTANTTPFKIGGETIEVPELNLYAQRVALRELPSAFTSGDPDKAVGAMLKVLEALLEDHPNESHRLSVSQIERRARGAEEINGINTQMMALLRASGFFENPATSGTTETPPALPPELEATVGSMLTAPSTESSSPSPESSAAPTSDGSSETGPSGSSEPS